MHTGYVHGYHPRESERLRDQANALVDLLHADTSYPSGASVLEAGCGVGAQTVTLAQRSPGARFTSIDVSATSLEEARRRVTEARLANVELRQADVFALPFPADSFDHVFVCFVLEHLARPVDALCALVQVLRPGGTLTVIEGDHGSAYFHPDDADARAVIDCLVTLQRDDRGDATIGRRLFPLLGEAGLDAVRVSPRMVYVDGSRPALAEGFTRRTFTAMVEAPRDRAIAAGLVSAETFDAGVRALNRAAEPDGVFCYTFFKGVAVKRGDAAASPEHRSDASPRASAADGQGGAEKSSSSGESSPGAAVVPCVRWTSTTSDGTGSSRRRPDPRHRRA
jgi:SAM-dependent methyltransferase